MHETGIAAELLRIATGQAAAHDAPAVLRLHVRIGAMSGVVAEALSFAFDALKAESECTRGAVLELELVPLAAHCRHCERDFYPEADLVLWCPQCGLGLDIMQGKDLDLAWVELEEKESAPCNESP